MQKRALGHKYQSTHKLKQTDNKDPRQNTNKRKGSKDSQVKQLAIRQDATSGRGLWWNPEEAPVPEWEVQPKEEGFGETRRKHLCRSHTKVAGSCFPYNFNSWLIWFCYSEVAGSCFPYNFIGVLVSLWFTSMKSISMRRGLLWKHLDREPFKQEDTFFATLQVT